MGVKLVSDKPSRVQIGVRLSSKTVAFLDTLAAEYETDRTTVMRYLLLHSCRSDHVMTQVRESLKNHI